MQISDLIANPRLAVEEIKGQTLQNLRPGQTVAARVSLPTVNEMAKIRIDNSEIPVSTRVTLTEGQNLTLTVVKVGERPEFQIARAPDSQELTARVLREILPKQNSVAKFMEKLATLAGEKPVTGNPSQTAQTQLAVLARGGPSPDPAVLANRMAAQIEGRPQPAINNAPAETQGRVSLKNDAQIIAKLLQQSTVTVKTADSARVTETLANLATRLTGNTVQTGDLKRPQPPLAQTQTQPAQTPVQSGNTAELAVLKGLLEPKVLEQIKTLLNQVGAVEKGISPELLRQALDQSGILLETKLAMGQPPSIDLKSSLLRLLFSIRPTAQASEQGNVQTQQQSSQTGSLNASLLRAMNEIQAQAESALARINMNQLASVAGDSDTRQVWQYELPLRHQEQTTGFMIRIEREAKPGETPEQACWSVLINFDLEPMGPISAKIGLSSDEVSSHFVAERSESVQKVEQALPKLDQAFQRAGLNVKHLSVRQGKAIQPPTASNLSRQLLDEKA